MEGYILIGATIVGGIVVLVWISKWHPRVGKYFTLPKAGVFGGAESTDDAVRRAERAIDIETEIE